MKKPQPTFTHEELLELFAGSAHAAMTALNSLDDMSLPVVPVSTVKQMLQDTLRLVQGAVAGKLFTMEELQEKIEYASTIDCTCNYISEEVGEGKTFDELKLSINEHFKKHLNRDATSEELHLIYDRTKQECDRSDTIESMMTAVGEALFGDQEPDSQERGKHLH